VALRKENGLWETLSPLPGSKKSMTNLLLGEAGRGREAGVRENFGEAYFWNAYLSSITWREISRGGRRGRDTLLGTQGRGEKP